VGTGEVTIAVSDAGPLIHLTEISCLPLLRIFDTLHIPDAVWSETVGQIRVAHDDILRLGTVRRHSFPQLKSMSSYRKTGWKICTL